MPSPSNHPLYLNLSELRYQLHLMRATAHGGNHSGTFIWHLKEAT